MIITLLKMNNAIDVSLDVPSLDDIVTRYCLICKSHTYSFVNKIIDDN